MKRFRTSWRQWLFPLRERLVCSEREALLVVGLSSVLLVGQVVRLVRAATPWEEPAELAQIDSLFDHIADSLRSLGPLGLDTVHTGFGTVFESPEEEALSGARMWVFVDTLEKPKATFPVAINRADLRMLQALPRIGPAMAARIVAWRETHGPFRHGEDLLDVPGIGPRTLEKLLPLVTFEDDRPSQVDGLEPDSLDAPSPSSDS